MLVAVFLLLCYNNLIRLKSNIILNGVCDMIDYTKITDDIHRITMPYKDIFTTVYTVRTDEGVLLFDAASYDEDITDYIVPFLDELGIQAHELKYVLISHNHRDHAGGLGEFMKRFPDTCIVSRCPILKDKFSDYCVFAPEDGDTILGVLKLVSIPGHTMDSTGIFDTRTGTLISGDSLQLYGIYGSGTWGANIKFPSEHKKAVEKLTNMNIECIITAHDYHPLGYIYNDMEKVSKALTYCIEPLEKVEQLICGNPDKNDDEIAAIYNEFGYPTLGAHVVSAIRSEMNK